VRGQEIAGVVVEIEVSVVVRFARFQHDLLVAAVRDELEVHHLVGGAIAAETATAS